MSDDPERNPTAGPVRLHDLTTKARDGTLLRGRSWSVQAPKATLLIAHGLGEHGGSYSKIAESLARSVGLRVAAFDFRGSGRSPGKRGFVKDYEELTSDLIASNNWLRREAPDLPRFLLGHSNGGLVAIHTLFSWDLGLSGLILSNPPFPAPRAGPAMETGRGGSSFENSPKHHPGDRTR